MVKYQAVQRSLSRRGFAAVIGVAALLPLAPTLAQQSTPPPPPSDPVAPVKVPAEVKTAVVKVATDEDSARDAKAAADNNPATRSPDPRASEAAGTAAAAAQNRSRDEEIVRLHRELEAMRAQLRAYEQQLRATRDERDARDARVTRTAPVPNNADPRQDGIESRTVTVVPSPRQTTNAGNNAPVPEGQVHVVTRNGVTFRELVPTQPQTNPPGEIVIRSADGQVQGLDRESGKILWAFRMNGPKVSAVNVERGVARIRLDDGKTLELDVPTGKMVGNATGVVRSRPGGDQEERLKSLEDKLDRLMKEVDRLNRNQNQDHNREPKPGTTP